MTTVKIRAVSAGDSLGLRHLYPRWSTETTKKRIQKSLLSKREQRFIAVFDGNVAGHIFLKQGSGNHEHITTLYSLIVDERQRGKGIAKAMMDYAFKHLPEGTEIVVLQVQHDNLAAQSLFDRFGFQRYGYLPKAFRKNGEYKDNILLHKDI